MADVLTAGDGQWWSQGAQWDDKTTWFDVKLHLAAVRDQLDIGKLRECAMYANGTNDGPGRQVALQMSFYARVTHAMTRFVVTYERDPHHWQVVALLQFIRLCAKCHGIRCFIILVRIFAAPR